MSPNAQSHQPTPPCFDYHTGVARLVDFRFSCGTVLPEVMIEYATVGTPCRDSEGTITNAFLFCHGAYSNYRSLDMWSDIVGPGKPIDTDRYYLICPTALGWPGSSAPSNTGLGSDFPFYTFPDIVSSQYRLLTEHLGITRLVCIAGPSFGAEVVLGWVTEHPDFAASAISVASGTQNHGKLYAILHLANEIISLDQAYQGGHYSDPPYRGLECYWSYFFLFLFSYDYYREKYATPEIFETKLEERKQNAHAFDANDVILFHNVQKRFSVEEKLAKIKARCLFIGFYEDQFCPPAENGAITLGQLTPGSEVRLFNSQYGHIGAVFDIRQAADDIRNFLEQRALILFVETRAGGQASGAAALFNAHALTHGINAVAIPRCFMADTGDARSALATETLAILREAGVPEEFPSSRRLGEADLFRAGRIISLDDGRHGDFYEISFPGWREKVEFWPVAGDGVGAPLAARIAELAASSATT